MSETSASGRHSSWSRALDISLIAAIALVAPLLVLRETLRPADAQAGVAVVYAPWTKAHEAVARATMPGAALTRFGAFGFIVVVKPDAANYVDRVLADGALLALDPKILALCAPGLLGGETS